MKLFFSAGSLLPMDRLLIALNNFVIENKGYSCTGQIGNSQLTIDAFYTQKKFEEKEFNKHFKSADVIISHAGMGNILLAEELKKPIIVMPRRPDLNEAINSHQLHTVKGFTNKDTIYIVNDESELKAAIEWAKAWSPQKNAKIERVKLINAINAFIKSSS